MPVKADEPSCSAFMQAMVIAMVIGMITIWMLSWTPTYEETIKVINTHWNHHLLIIAQRKKVHTSLAFLPAVENQSLHLKEEEVQRQLSPDQSKILVKVYTSTLYQMDVQSILKHQVLVYNFSSN